MHNVHNIVFVAYTLCTIDARNCAQKISGGIAVRTYVVVVYRILLVAMPYDGLVYRRMQHEHI